MRRPDRRLFRDPPPLPPDEPYTLDDELEERVDRAIRQMREFDAAPELVRLISLETNRPSIAVAMIRSGVRTREHAEMEVRYTLGSNHRGRR